MRPPILFLTVAFGVGLWLGLDPFAFPDGILWGAVLPLAAASVWLASRAPVGAAVGVMAVAGTLWGRAAVREREATCAGNGKRETVAVAARLLDPVSEHGGVVDAEVLPGTCGGSLRLRWPEGSAVRGGTTWVVAGRWSGVGEG